MFWGISSPRRAAAGGNNRRFAAGSSPAPLFLNYKNKREKIHTGFYCNGEQTPWQKKTTNNRKNTTKSQRGTNHEGYFKKKKTKN